MQLLWCVYVWQHALLCHLRSVLVVVVVVVARVHSIGRLKVALSKGRVVSFRASECRAVDVNMLCRDAS